MTKLVESLTPEVAVARALAFIEDGVTGSFVPDALITIRGRGSFGRGDVRGSQQQANVSGLEEAYKVGGARFMARALRWHLEDLRDIVPLPDVAGRIIERFDPTVPSQR